jgi:hypothetical protein
MPDHVDPKAFVNLCEMRIDSMYELGALGELLEKKGSSPNKKFSPLHRTQTQESACRLRRNFTPTLHRSRKRGE